MKPNMKINMMESLVGKSAFSIPDANGDLDLIAEQFNNSVGVAMKINSIMFPNGVVHQHVEIDDAGEVNMKYSATHVDLNSAWFDLCHEFGWENPMIISWRPTFATWDPEGERSRELNKLRVFLGKMDLNLVMTRLNARDIQVYANTTVDNEGLSSRLGLEVRTGIEVGKLMKRMGIFSVSEGTLFNPEPNMGHELKLLMEDRPEADGSLMMSYEFAEMLCRNSGVQFDQDVTRIQIWISTTMGLLKGMAMVRPKGVPLRDGMELDLVVPFDSLDPNFRTRKVTIGKFVTHSVKRREPVLKAFDGLLRMPEFVKHVDHVEILQVQAEMMERQDNEEMKFAIDTAAMRARVRDNDEDDWEVGRLVRKMETRLYDKSMMDLADLGGMSLFVSPEVMRMGTDRLLRHLVAKQKSWTSNDGQMPGVYVSCLRAYWTNPEYAGQEEPERSYVGFLWNGDDIDGFYLNSLDHMDEQVRYRSDGGDLDDLLDGVLVTHVGQKLIWLVRNPTSWGGGWFMRVRDEDWDKAIGLGYHSYILRNGYEIKQLPTIAQDPNQGLKINKGKKE